LKQVAVLSGKGGTGKTSVSASLIHIASREMELVMADADVDAANLDLLLNGTILEEHAYTGGFRAGIDQDLCSGCGRCREVCRFGAVQQSNTGAFTIDGIKCEGCNACVHQCPEKAISSRRRQAGTWFRSSTPYGDLFHAEMLAGEENSGKLVSLIRKSAQDLGTSKGSQMLLLDGPPGIGCPVIASCTGADLVLVVTEPGISAIHDLRRVLGTAAHFNVPSAVCVNRFDINPARAMEIEDFCSDSGIPFIGRIPYDDTVPESISRGIPFTEYRPESPASIAVANIWNELSEII
jgi:MinD superfamily P-loop ATPase